MAYLVKQHRIAKGWTQARLAKESGVSQATISMIELGKQEPNAQTLLDLARGLRVAPHKLVNSGFQYEEERSALQKRVDDLLASLDPEDQEAWVAALEQLVAARRRRS